MNVATHQEKEKNKKTVKGKAGEDRPILKRLRATLLRSFKGLHGEKIICVRGVLGVTGILGKANSHFNPTQTGGDRTTTLRRLLIGAVQFCSLYMYILYDRNFALYYPKRSESIRVLGTDRKSVMMIRVKVNSKSELVENREGKPTLYGVICCCDDRLLSRAVICGHTI